MLKLGFEAGLSLTQGFANGVKKGLGISRDEIDAIVREAAERFKIDPNLIHAIIKNESRYHNKAVSPKGAEGLMQLMPGTAAHYGVEDSTPTSHRSRRGRRSSTPSKSPEATASL